MNGFGFSTLSRSGSSWTAAIPTGLLVTVLSETSIKLDWTNVDTKGDGVSIERSTDGVNYSEIDTVALGIATFTDTGLSGNHFYYRVKSYKGTKQSNPSTAVVNAAPLCLWDGHTIGWYESHDTSTITKDVSNNVSIWWDKLNNLRTLGPELSSGSTLVNGIYKITAREANHFYVGDNIGDTFCAVGAYALDANNKVQKYVGNHLGNGVVNNMPLWSTDGLTFDHVSDYMRTNKITYNQPSMNYMVLKQVSWTNAGNIFGGFDPPTNPLINQNGSTPSILAYAGGGSPSSNELAVGDFGVIRCLFNGANSKLQVNANAAKTGNFGAANMEGISIAYRDANFGHIQVKCVISRDCVEDAGDETAIYNYVSSTVFF